VGSCKVKMKCRCLGFEGAEVASSSNWGSGIASGARTGWRCRKMGTVVTGVTPVVISIVSSRQSI
jgi:hypothetical protein